MTQEAVRVGKLGHMTLCADVLYLYICIPGPLQLGSDSDTGSGKMEI